MNHSILVHVSKKITRSQLNRAIASQLHSQAPQGKRAFSSTSTSASITIWGSHSTVKSLSSRTTGSLLVGLQPIRSTTSLKRHISTLQLRERDPNSDGSPAENGSGIGSSSSSGENGGGGDNDDKSSKHLFNSSDNQLQKPSVPEVYPQVLALPIARRPLFPGFYKAVVINDPNVTGAIKDLLKRGQPYVGAFLLKDENVDVDTITSLDQVHKVGVFAQITSVFPANNGSKNKDEDGGLTAVLYPHRRIQINELINTKGKGAIEAKVEEHDNVKSETEAQDLAVKESSRFDGDPFIITSY